MLARAAAIRPIVRATTGALYRRTFSSWLAPRSIYNPTTKSLRGWSSRSNTRHLTSSITRQASPTASPPTSHDPLEAESQRLIDQASGLLEKGDVEGAKALYQKSVSMKSSSTGYYNLGITLYQLKRLPEAIKAWESSLNLAASSDVHTNLASAYILSEPPQPHKALEHLKSAVELDPEDGEIRFNLAAVNEANNHLDDALAEYHHAKRLGIARAEQNIRNVGAKLLRRRLQEEENLDKNKDNK
ncbi:hypothetical protein CROQUDRAFT_71401 [Cronartium quercuum f. sp. fusiforme G11]|uniref:TPR-like protein n=1 Tax=Cronartium quercuum f. sp. fusiforme G11 TaxID=708437 RepID=A0A9P6TH38_9BASI|nr:hypothetical protein CROQUDRAFT_71401 [Cronartium quercuum f. sp. fusiforme G11]